MFGVPVKGSLATPSVDLALRVRFDSNLERSWFGALMQVINNVAMLSIIRAGAALIRERKHGTVEHLLVMTVSPTVDGHLMRLQRVKAGETLGSSWMFSDYLPKLSARALEATEMVYFRGDRLWHQCEQAPDLGYRLFRRVAGGTTQRLQATREMLPQRTAVAKPNGRRLGDE